MKKRMEWYNNWKRILQGKEKKDNIHIIHTQLPFLLIPSPFSYLTFLTLKKMNVNHVVQFWLSLIHSPIIINNTIMITSIVISSPSRERLFFIPPSHHHDHHHHPMYQNEWRRKESESCQVSFSTYYQVCNHCNSEQHITYIKLFSCQVRKWEVFGRIFPPPFYVIQLPHFFRHFTSFYHSFLSKSIPSCHSFFPTERIISGNGRLRERKEMR